MAKITNLTELHRPVLCKECNGVMVFKGLGSYICEDCGKKEYDDYGKARNFIESRPGANISEIAEATGISRKTINDMLKDGRFEIAANSKTFLLCEVCGVSIRFGRVCTACEASYHKHYEEDVRKTNILGGFGKAERSDDAEGAKRFKRSQF